MRCGGQSNEKPVDDTVLNVFEAVRGDYESQHCKVLEIVSYKSQVVAGVNYFIKVRTEAAGDNKYSHLRVYRHFSGSTTLHSFQKDKALSDEIGYF